MMPIDIFIDQLIQLGLADSFLDVIEKHYLKVSSIYSYISCIDTNNIKDIEYIGSDCEDSITVIMHLYNPIEEIIVNSTDDLTIQCNNDGNVVTITVSNNYESEEEIYETRLSKYEKVDTHKWS